MEYFQIIDLFIQRTLHSKVIHIQNRRLIINFRPTIHPLHILIRFGLVNHIIIDFELLFFHDFIIGRWIWWRQIDPIIYIHDPTDCLHPDLRLSPTPGVEMRRSVDFDNGKFSWIFQVQLWSFSFFEITLDYVPKRLSFYLHIGVVVGAVGEDLAGEVYVDVAFEVLAGLEEISRFAFRFFVKAAHD